MDFVAGWLGTLPNFIKSNWYIDPVTRQSRGSTSNVIDLKQEFDLCNYITNSCSLSLSSDSDIYYATKAHRINMCHMPHVVSGDIKVCQIVPDNDTDERRVHWEFLLKTYGKLEFDGSWTIDRLITKQDITDDDRVQKLDQLLSNQPGHDIYCQVHKDVNFPKLLYSKLFEPGGSIYLCEVLKLQVEHDYHVYWDTILPLAQTPSTVTLWGQQWNIQDYFN